MTAPEGKTRVYLDLDSEIYKYFTLVMKNERGIVRPKKLLEKKLEDVMLTVSRKDK